MRKFKHIIPLLIPMAIVLLPIVESQNCDILLAFDMSETSHELYEQEVNLGMDLIGAYTNAFDQSIVRFAYLTFSSNVAESSTFGSFTSANQMVMALNNSATYFYIDGITNTYSALSVSKTIVQVSARLEMNVLRIVVLFSNADHDPTTPDPQEIAADIRFSGNTIIAIRFPGTQNNTNITELTFITGSSTNVLSLYNYNNMQNILNILTTYLPCSKGSPSTATTPISSTTTTPTTSSTMLPTTTPTTSSTTLPTTTTTPISTPTTKPTKTTPATTITTTTEKAVTAASTPSTMQCDIMFILDMTETYDYESEIQFAQFFLEQFNNSISSQFVRFAWVPFSNFIFNATFFGTFTTVDSYVQAISLIGFYPGTPSAAYIAFVQAQGIFDSTSKSDVQRIALYISNGRFDPSTTDPCISATYMHDQSNVTTYSIAMSDGSAPNISELTCISGSINNVLTMDPQNVKNSAQQLAQLMPCAK